MLMLDLLTFCNPHNPFQSLTIGGEFNPVHAYSSHGTKQKRTKTHKLDWEPQQFARTSSLACTVSLTRDRTAHVYMLLPVAVHGRPWRETERRLCKGIPNTTAHTKWGNVGRLQPESSLCRAFADLTPANVHVWMYTVAENLLLKILLRMKLHWDFFWRLWMMITQGKHGDVFFHWAPTLWKHEIRNVTRVITDGVVGERIYFGQLSL